MERSEVEKVVQGFLDASYARDWQAMETLFHDGFEFFGHDENGALRKHSKEVVVGNYRARATDESWPYYPSYNEIVSLDFTGENTAVARTRLRIQDRIYTDILCVMRVSGVWGIVAKMPSSEPVE